MLPYIVVLVAALAGVNVFVVLIVGTVLSVVVGVACGTIAPVDIFVVIGSGPDGKSGVMNMYDITVISIVCSGIIGLVKANGGIDWILGRIRSAVKSKPCAFIPAAAVLF